MKRPVRRSTPARPSPTKTDLVARIAALEKRLRAVTRALARKDAEADALAHELSETRTRQTAAAEILAIISSSPTDVHPVFDAVAASAARLCGAIDAIVFRVDRAVGPIRSDERKVKQMLLNLLSNALKFTPEGGRVEVSAAVGDGMVEVAVADTGVGIAPEDQEAVFEEFRQVGTASKKIEGTGLGLALSRKFIELHGGRIWVKSAVGTGSTFTFTLPLTPRT